MNTVQPVASGHERVGDIGPVGPRFVVLLVSCLIVTAALTMGSLVIGTSSISTSLEWLRSPDTQTTNVMWNIRLPRALGAWFAGALLGLGGSIAQGLFRNPLADPYLLGSASGAALGVSIGLIASASSLGSLAWAGEMGVTGTAFIGAVSAVALTLALSRGVLQTTSLLLGGIVVAFLLSAVTSLLLLSSPETWRAMQVFLLGSTSLLSWQSTGLLSITLVICIVPAVLLARGLEALSLGEETAASLGVSLPALRIALLAILSLATASTVAQVGVIGFVGLIAPHLVRESLHVTQRQMLLAAPLCGGVLLQAADLLSRWAIRPAELPVGIVTACLGGSYLVMLLRRRVRDA